MGTIINRPTVYGTVSVTVGNPPVTTVYTVARGLTGYVQVRDTPYPKRPKGWKPPTPYRKYGQDDDRYGLRSAFGRVKLKSQASGSVRIGVDTQNTVVCNLGSFDPDVANKAIIQARNNLKGQRVNFAQAFAERKQTANLVTDTAKRITKGIHAARRGDLRGIAESLGLTRTNNSRSARKLAARIRRTSKSKPGGSSEQDVHNLWLRHQYGWKPLLNDVYGSAQLLAERDTADPKRYMFSCKGSASSKTSTSSVFDGSGLFGHYQCRKTTRSVITKKAMVRLDSYLDNPGLQSLASAGFTNPATLAWELLPFSFVADWFIPIGSYLNSMDASVGWKFRGGSISKKMDGRTSVMISALPSVNMALYDYYSVGGHGYATAYDLERIVYTAYPVPTSILPKNPFSASHVLSAIALMAQQFLRRR